MEVPVASSAGAVQLADLVAAFIGRWNPGEPEVHRVALLGQKHVPRRQRSQFADLVDEAQGSVGELGSVREAVRQNHEVRDVVDLAKAGSGDWPQGVLKGRIPRRRELNDQPIARRCG